MAGIEDQEQFLLRLRKDSQPDKILREIVNAKKNTDTLVGKHGIGRDGIRKTWINYIVNWAKLFDNISVSRAGSEIHGSYMDPMPSTPISIGVDVANIAGQLIAGDASTPQTPLSNIRWPQMPPLCQTMDNFRKPVWYDTMKVMVGRGKHIALSGPPGVGKDTAVIQFAAEEGHPLVTIGGDAGFRRRDLVGTAHISQGSSYFEVAEYAAAAVNGWWVLLTEVNAADADALMYINAQMAAPYIVTLNGKAYPVHPDFRIFVSYNPGLIGTKPLPQSFKDRFFSIQVPFYTESQLHRILEAHGLPDDAPWADALVKFGVNLWGAHVRGQLRYQVSTRRLIDAIVLMDSDVVSSIKEAIELAVLASIDSPIEQKAAETVLRETIAQWRF